MNVRTFILSSSVCLIAWLGATFVFQVPAQSYPPLGRGVAPVKAESAHFKEPKSSHWALFSILSKPTE